MAKPPQTISEFKLPFVQQLLGAPLTANRKIFRAATVVAFFSSLVLIGSVAKELVIARWFGRGDDLDAFVIAFLLPSFLVNLVAGSVNSALIPTFVQVRETQGKEATQRLFSSVMVWTLGLLLGVSILIGLLAPYVLPLLGSGFSAGKLALTRKLLYLLLPFITLSGLVTLWTSVLNAGERFALPALLPILSPVTIILFLVLGSGIWGIYALAVGMVLGVALQTAALAFILKSHGIHLSFRWHGMDANLRQFATQFAPLIAGSLLMGSTDLVDQSMSAMLEPGSVAALNYAKKVVSILVVVGVIPLTTAVLPYFSQMVAKRDWGACRHTLKTYSRLILLVTFPITLGLVFFSQPLIRIMFQRGAFMAADTQVVSRVMACLSLQIPFYILGNMGVRMISALKRNALLTTIAAVNMVLNIVLNYVLMKYAGVAGIALSTSLVYLASCIMVFGSISVTMRRLAAQEPAGGNSGL
jgi:putative peptidoglycan lipid II flippase